MRNNAGCRNNNYSNWNIVINRLEIMLEKATSLFLFLKDKAKIQLRGDIDIG